MRSGNRRGEDAGVSAHTNMVAKQYPKKGKGFGVQTNGSIGDVKETKRFKYKMNRSLWRGISLFIARRTESFKPTKACGLASVLCGLGHRTEWE